LAPISIPRHWHSLERGKRIVELFKQGLYAPIPVEEQVLQLMSAVQNSYFDQFPIGEIRTAQGQDSRLCPLTARKEVLESISKEGKITKETAQMLQDTMSDFKNIS